MKPYNKYAANVLYAYQSVLSDEDCKQIISKGDPKEIAAMILEHGSPFSRQEVIALVEAAGDMDDDHSFSADGKAWKDDTLDKYAKYIRNYKYTYKEEAKQIDPSIDTNTEHNGPMAQDIEKVNPAAVVEDASGYKTVDTGRLALMNAGAIADLAREIQMLKDGA